MMKRTITACLCGALVSLALSPARAENPPPHSIPLFLPYPTIDTSKWYMSDGWTNGEHQSCEWRKDALSPDDGNLKMTLSDKGGKVRPLGCAEIHTINTSGYGLYEARMKTAAGSGLNTAFFTYIGPPTGGAQHDEIDFEFLGKDSHTVQLNYLTAGQGGHEKIIQLGFDAAKGFHDYAIDWQPGKIRWLVDGKQVYETPAGAGLPVTPGRIYLSLWSGSEKVNDWLGPFSYTRPVSAEASWVKFTPDDANPLHRP
jgi:endo-1,3-1,4-beta-glycanase ExoK